MIRATWSASCSSVPGRRQRHLAHVVAEVDLGLLDPVGMVEPERDLGQPPAQRRQLRRALGEQQLDLFDPELAVRAVDASSIARLPTWPVWREFSRARNCASRLVSCRMRAPYALRHASANQKWKVRSVSPSAGTRPDAAMLVDLDELYAAYRREPQGPVSFGTSAIAAVRSRARSPRPTCWPSARRSRDIEKRGDHRPAVRRARHARAVGAGLPHRDRGVRRPRHRGPRRRRRRLHADAGALATRS